MTLKELADQIELLRTQALMGDPARGTSPLDTANLTALAEQEFLSCLACLDLARAAARRALIAEPTWSQHAR